MIKVKEVKVEEVDLYSTIFWALHYQCTQVWITQFYLQIRPYLPIPRKRSPDGATADCCDQHLIAAYYSFIDPGTMKDWVDLVGWPIADSLLT